MRLALLDKGNYLQHCQVMKSSLLYLMGTHLIQQPKGHSPKSVQSILQGQTLQGGMSSLNQVRPNRLVIDESSRL